MSKQNRKSFRYWLWQNHFKLSSNSTEAGGSLIIALSLGVLMIGGTTTMLFTSNQNKTNATADEMSVRAQEVAELGITRVHNFLANNPRLAELNYDEWEDEITSGKITQSNDQVVTASSGGGTCTNVVGSLAGNTIGLDDIELITTKQAVNNNNFAQGGFEIKEYTYNDSAGSLIIKSSVNPSATNLDSIFNSGVNNISQSQIEVQIPVPKRDPNDIPFPGVWLGDQSSTSRSNPVDANVMINGADCNKLQLQVPKGRKFIISSAKFPDMPVFPDASDTGVYDLGDLTGAGMNITLPRSGDQYDNEDDKVYHYIVNNISGSGSRTLTITPGKKVYIYLKGKMEISGSAEISHVCGSVTDCRPDNFRIYGYGYKTGDKPAALGSQNLPALAVSQDPLLCLRGSGASQGFIFAPGYQAMVSGAGAGSAFYGSVWVKRWAGSDVNCGSNTSNTVITQDTTNWDTLGLVPQGLAPRIGSISSWQRKPVN